MKSIQEFLNDVSREVARARELFPGNDKQLHAFTEEAGEVTKAMLDQYYGGKGVDDVKIYRECVRAAAMACRVATEGDREFTYGRQADYVSD